VRGNLLATGPAGLAGCEAGPADPEPDRARGGIGPTLGRGKIPGPEPTENRDGDPALGFTGGPALLLTELPAGAWLEAAVGWLLLLFEWFPG
jgi:hypothetical protein